MEEKELRLMFVKYMMASFLYYIHDEDSPLSDYEYDILCKTLYDNWEDFDHQHKHLADRESLSAGTGYDIRWYPTIVQSSAWQWRRDHGK